MKRHASVTACFPGGLWTVCAYIHWFHVETGTFQGRHESASLTPRNRADGVTVGLLIFVFYFGNLLHWCGDVELNPGPPKQDFFRQTRLTSSSRANNAELNSQEGNSTSNGETVGSDPTLKDMHMLTTMSSKFDDMKNDMSDIRSHTPA